MERTVCPKCGEAKVEVHTLGDGKLGAWCSNCLAGVPSKDIGAADSIEEVIKKYEEFEALLNSGKIR